MGIAHSFPPRDRHPSAAPASIPDEQRPPLGRPRRSDREGVNFSAREHVYEGVKRMLPGVALLAIVAGCGSQASSTRLTVQVSDSAGTRVYRLQCDPAKGTARNPEAMCAALRQQPDMLSAPRSIVCGPGGAPTERIRVNGSF